MHEQSRDKREFRSLLERAYGPNADIHEDPAAMERLRGLEETRHATLAEQAQADPGAVPAASALGPTEQDAPTSHALPLEPAEFTRLDAAWPESVPPGDAEAVAGDAAAVRAGTTRSRRFWAGLWAGTLIVAALVGAGIAYHPAQQPGTVGVLTADPDAPWPGGFGSRVDGAKVFQDFHGLAVVLVPQDWGTGEPLPCLFVLPDLPDATIIGAGCGAGEFDPTAAVRVTEDLSDELLALFEVGGALQFVLHQGQVNIYSDEP